MVHVAAGQAYRTGVVPSVAVMPNGASATLQPNTQYTFTSDVEIVVKVVVQPEEEAPPDLEASSEGSADSKRRRGYPDKMLRPAVDAQRLGDYEDKAD